VMKILVTTIVLENHSVLVLITLHSSIVLVNMLMNISIVKTLIILPYVMKVKQNNAIEINVLNHVVKRINLSVLILDLV
jgi:hypothetical protein